MKKLEFILNISKQKEIIIKAIKIALIVGIILNIINQGDLILEARFEDINYFKLIFTFCVPFCVSMYTAISMKMKFKVNNLSLVDTRLECSNCNSVLTIKKNDLIPECDKCLKNTKWKMKD